MRVFCGLSRLLVGTVILVAITAIVGVCVAAEALSQSVSNPSGLSFRQARYLQQQAVLGANGVEVEQFYINALQQHWEAVPAYTQQDYQDALDTSDWQKERDERWTQYCHPVKDTKQQNDMAGAITATNDVEFSALDSVSTSANDESGVKEGDVSLETTTTVAPAFGENPDFDAWIGRTFGGDLPSEMHRRIQYRRTYLGQRLVRMHLEQGDVKAAQEAWDRMVPFKAEESVLYADLLFARSKYQDAMELYQDQLQVLENGFAFNDWKPWIDDVLFTKMALACVKTGKMEQARRFLECAAELQERHGLVVESLLTAWRIHALCQPHDSSTESKLPFCSKLSSDIAEHYPILTNYLCGGGNGNDNDAALFLEQATESLMIGDYVQARKLFLNAHEALMTSTLDTPSSGVSREVLSLRTVYLRERELSDLADAYREPSGGDADDVLPDPLFLLKKHVLLSGSTDPMWSILKEIDDKNKEENLTSFSAFLGSPNFFNSGLQSIDAYSDTDEIVANWENDIQKIASSSVRAAGYIQLSKYLIKLANTKRPEIGSSDNQEQSKESVQALFDHDASEFNRQQKQREESLGFVQKAMDETDISPLLQIETQVLYADVENQKSVSRQTERGKDGVQIISCTPTNEYGEPVGPKKTSTALLKLKDSLEKARKELTENSLSNSLTALDVARMTKKVDQTGGIWEREVLFTIFGEASKPVLARRRDAAQEDLRYGTGEKAEALFAELWADKNERKKHPFLIDNFIASRKKQGKFAEAIKLFEEARKIEEFRDPDFKLHYLADLAKLHVLNDNLAAASQVYHEMIAIGEGVDVDNESFRARGYIGLGDILLAQGDMKKAQESFDRGLAFAQARLDGFMSTNNEDDPMEAHKDMMISNAINDVGRCLESIANSYVQQGYYNEAMSMLEKKLVVVDNELYKFSKEVIEHTKEKMMDIVTMMNTKAHVRQTEQ